MVRALNFQTVEADLAELMRAAERAGLALACIDAEESRLVLPGDEPAARVSLGRVAAWTVTAGLTAVILLV